MEYKIVMIGSGYSEIEGKKYQIELVHKRELKEPTTVDK